MADVFPRRNLPGDADNWGRIAEDRITGLDGSIVQLRQGLQSQNRNTASSLEVLAGQIKAVEDAQAEIRVAQAAIIATTNFLSTQTYSDARSNQDMFTGTNSGTTWHAFNSTYDCSVTLTTGAAGRLLIQATSNLIVGDLTALLGIEVVGVIGPTFPGPYSTYLSSNTGAAAGVSRSVVAQLSANTSYTVRTRRGTLGNATGSTGWASTSLVVTRS